MAGKKDYWPGIDLVDEKGDPLDEDDKATFLGALLAKMSKKTVKGKDKSYSPFGKDKTYHDWAVRGKDDDKVTWCDNDDLPGTEIVVDDRTKKPKRKKSPRQKTAEELAKEKRQLEVERRALATERTEAAAMRKALKDSVVKSRKLAAELKKWVDQYGRMEGMSDEVVDAMIPEE